MNSIINDPIIDIKTKEKVIFKRGDNELYRKRMCNSNLAGNNPASQYQRLKLIQNTVRVPSSLYTMNLGALNAYEKPRTIFGLVDNSGTNYIVSPGVNWNQMSDRKDPHVQVSVTASGATYHTSSTKHTITRLRPGALSPGGIGVDIKHNSYDRYLNRIKGKAPLRRGVIPPHFGIPFIPFDIAFPIYGGKTIKTSIISKCDCPLLDKPVVDIVYNKNNEQNNIEDVTYQFNIGDSILTKKHQTNVDLVKAIIIDKINNKFVVKVESDNTILTKNTWELFVYFNCNDKTNDDDVLLYGFDKNTCA